MSKRPEPSEEGLEVLQEPRDWNDAETSRLATRWQAGINLLSSESRGILSFQGRGTVMRRMLVILLAIVVGLTGLSLTNVALAARSGGNLQAQVAEVREATARYHDEDAAIAAGYLRTDHCIEEMGYHYVNPALIFDGGVLDPEEPEILLYAPTPNGRRLVAVEYLVPVADTGGTHPDLFGKPFDGPMPEHEPDTTGDHYDQHAWIWSRNAAGVLATWNTAVDC